MMYDLGTLDLAACFAAVILAAFGGRPDRRVWMGPRTMNEDEEQAREIAHANEILNAVRHAIAAEREACARIVEKLAGADVVYPEGIRMIAAAIRARGNKP